jgi:hypothetical protein
MQGGQITHEYTIIPGFAANVPLKMTAAVESWEKDGATVEEDQTMHTNE